MTWLLAEDDTDIRTVISVMMTVWGEQPLVFPDGNAAWRWLDSVENGSFQGELPELALMDIRMPGHWGDKIAARIRKTPAVGDIPIILMTAFTLSEAEVKSMKEQTGVDHLINKPLPDLDVFRSMLYEVRDSRRKAKAQKPEKVENHSSTALNSATNGNGTTEDVGNSSNNGGLSVSGNVSTPSV
ncbi:MAG: response regulator [Anaerolineae bacterium]|nr:response regulator [Anaerolineae bacterium]